MATSHTRQDPPKKNLPVSPLTEAQREELERRWRGFEQDPDGGEPWQEVKKELLDE
jgi:putative addiction module component (TIGR02574 family)